MEFEYKQLSREASAEIRQRFIDLFIDVEDESYVKYILPLKPDDIWVGHEDWHIVSYLWNSLKNEYRNKAKLSEITDYLQNLGDKEIYVMFDIRPKKHIYPDNEEDCKTLTYPYTNLFSSDTVVKMSAAELSKVIINDVNATAYKQLIFGDDLYAFDESFQWFIATTHSFVLDDNGCDTDEKICYGKI